MATLPTFRVILATDSGCSGEFEPSGMIGEGLDACLVLPSGRVMWGRFTQVDIRTHAATFQFDPDQDITPPLPGERFLYLDGYWGEQAEIVLDSRLKWEYRPFTPSDAIYFANAGGSIATEAADAPPGGTIVPGGWDHEHCVVCMETIGAGGLAEGWTTGGEHWACPSCYRNYVEARSLDFINAE